MGKTAAELSFLFPSWPREAPALFGPFHIVMSALSILLPVWVVRVSHRLSRKKCTERLFHIGIALLVLELFKQAILFFAVNNLHYDLWYFPFQLCSVPMYLCLVLPGLSDRQRDTVFTFLFDFSLPGAVLALIFPMDMLRSSAVLTMHAFLWHGLLIYAGLLPFHARLVKADLKGFRSAALLYLFLCLIAIGLNCLLDPLAVYGGRPNLFYLSPLVITGQPVFHEIALRFGILPGMILYVLSYLLLCFLVHLLCMRAYKKEL